MKVKGDEMMIARMRERMKLGAGFCLFCVVSAAQIQSAFGAFEPPPSKARALSVGIETEGGRTDNFLSKRRGDFSIPYLELSLGYRFSSHWRFLTQLEFISLQGAWDLSLEQTVLSYHHQQVNFPFIVTAGLTPVPLGRQHELLKEFSRPLRIYSLLLDKPTDTGLIVELPFGEDKEKSLIVSRFKGYEKRGFDDRFQAPDFSPLIIALQAQKAWGDVFGAFLRQNKAFTAPLSAFGAGGKAAFRPWGRDRPAGRRGEGGGGAPHHDHEPGGGNPAALAKRFVAATNAARGLVREISLQGEAWAVSEKRQTALGFYILPKMKFAEKWEAGFLLETINSFSPGYRNFKAFSSVYERAVQVSYETAPGIFIIGERFLSKQKGGPWLRKLWAVRLKARLQF